MVQVFTECTAASHMRSFVILMQMLDLSSYADIDLADRYNFA